jgi:hypothetical protein
VLELGLGPFVGDLLGRQREVLVDEEPPADDERRADDHEEHAAAAGSPEAAAPGLVVHHRPLLAMRATGYYRAGTSAMRATYSGNRPR